MMKDIRAHWIQLKAEYENRYEESFLEDFERSKDYLEQMKEYQEAKDIFEKLITVYPDRMWLKLCIAYCDVALGNKNAAISYLENIKIGSDDNYDLNTDDIMEYQVFDAYYALEEYDRFLSYCTEEVESEYYTVDWEHLYYVLWISGKRDRFTRLEEKNRKYLEGAVADAIIDTEYDSEKEKQETLESWEKDKRDFEEMISRIKYKQLRPEMELKLYPEYSCYIVDCVRHKF